MDWWMSILRLVAAVAIGCAIGVEREHKNRPAGMRTHILVCFGAALVAVLDCLNAQHAILLNTEYASPGVAVSIGRMSAQVISGIGFLGAGTIFVAQKKIAGLTTAASLWATGCLGLAAGMGYFVPALVGCALVLLTLTVMQRFVHPGHIKRVDISYVRRSETMPFIKSYFDKHGIRVLDVDYHAETSGEETTYTNHYTLSLPTRAAYRDIVLQLSENEHIRGIHTSDA